MRSPEGRTVSRLQESPGVDAVTPVALDLELRAVPLIVLGVESLLRPSVHDLPQLRLGAFRVVHCESQGRHHEGIQVRHYMAVIPGLRLLEEERPSAAQLGDLSPGLERPEGKQGGAVDFKSRSRALGAKYDSGPVTNLAAPLPLPGHITRSGLWTIGLGDQISR